MNTIIDSFRSKAQERCGMLLFQSVMAIDIVSNLKNANIPVLGIDGFKILGEKIQPNLEESIDLSKNSENSCDLALKFLTERIKSDYFFSVAVAEE